jgi:hypothetical protein
MVGILVNGYYGGRHADLLGRIGSAHALHAHPAARHRALRQDFSLFPTENEVILPPNTEFEVVATVNLGHELTQVQCKQIESLDMILDMSEGYVASTPTPAPAPGR